MIEATNGKHQGAMIEATNGKHPKSRTLRVLYKCAQCPAYCCSYDRIEVTKRDLLRIAKHFGISYKQAEKKYTKIAWGDRVLRHQKDHIFKSVCEFLNTEERRCTIYDARPSVCRSYPDGARCGYYDFLASERRRQGDDEFIPSA
ncbi:MAG TPA: YkgJ family cysteine cluster protein [Blastocatellia bacterium]|nr:YkgJ family cysteine cluster protein [Blastocatellia bacterium]